MTLSLFIQISPRFVVRMSHNVALGSFRVDDLHVSISMISNVEVLLVNTDEYNDGDLKGQ
jgi:hypothetical protein